MTFVINAIGFILEAALVGFIVLATLAAIGRGIMYLVRRD